MARPAGIIEKRLANALINEAEPGAMAKKLLGRAGQVGLAAATKLVGGMWVGGTVYLTSNTVEFHPNALNKIAHTGAGDMSVIVDLRDIETVTKRFGIGTQIIEIAAGGATLSVRCYNSQSFMDAIETARAKLA